MKVAISASATGANAELDPHFGRCAYFVLYDSDNGRYESIPNPARTEGSGAGIRAAQTVIDQGVGVVITGSLGPNASKVLEAAGIECYAGTGNVVKESVSAFENGLLAKAGVSPARR
ncbi:MAG: NifB/NifX family molybdenum-iron cluster-binding protein [Bacillota bacterium]